MNLHEYFGEKQRLVNEAIKTYVGKAARGNEEIYAAVAYSLDAGGKRIRPILALATAETLEAALEPVLPFACALEMIHTYSLIHDDLPSMDDDDLRRGRATNHKIFGEANAILAGDALLTKAFETLAGSASMTLEVIRELACAAGIDGMVGGQAMDLQAEGKDLALADLERIHTHKTGALLRCAVTGSARLCGADANALEALKTYGSCVGLAFQIADDVLDIEGGVDLGKDIGSDVENKKATYPKFLGVAEAKKRAQTTIDRALQALSGFGASAEPLRELAKFIVNRKN